MRRYNGIDDYKDYKGSEDDYVKGKKAKRLKPSIRKLDIPYSLVQENLSVEVKRWTGDKEVRYDLVLRTSNSYVSHSLSRQQLVLLKKAVNEFKF